MALVNRGYTAYQVSFPQIPTNFYNFNFTVSSIDGTYQFFFNFMSNNVENNTQGDWYFYAITPSGDTRWGAVRPNSCCWYGYPDVGVYFLSNLPVIGQNDIPNNVTMYLLYWQ